MTEEQITEIRRALTAGEIEAIYMRESVKRTDMSYWLDALLRAAENECCDLTMMIRDKTILVIKVVDRD